MTDDPSAPDRHWFEPIADHLGETYLRYSFTKGTANEVEFLVDALELAPGSRVLDVGCGPGRHAVAVAQLGHAVVGVDVSERFLGLARARAEDAGVAALTTFRRIDARRLPFEVEFDAAFSVCQGGFGLLGGPAAGDGQPADGDVLAGMTRALRPGGRLAVSAFSAYFQVRHLDDSTTFDAATGTNHEVTDVKDPAGATREVDLWTTCFTPRELRLMAASARLDDVAVHSVSPGRYGRAEPNVDDEELLLLARRPPAR